MAISKERDFFIQLHLTEGCNLRCKHCYQTGRKGGEMNLSEIKDVIAEISEMIKDWSENYDIPFSRSFNITGGEPFLREDLDLILEEIGGKGFDIYILSNGTLVNKEKAKMLSAFDIKGVQISMEGTEEIQEKIRGKGSFSASIKGIRNLLDQGIKVTINTTLSDINADNFMEMISLASSLGVQRLGFSRLVPSGRGAGLINRMLKKERVKELYNNIFSINLNGLEIVTGDPVVSQMSSSQEDGGSVPKGGCAAGVSGLTILPDGTITPCRRMPVPIGNIRRDSLREVWATSEVLESLRDKTGYKGKCGTCTRWAFCRGCRAIAYACSLSGGEGDFLAEDPQCFID